MRYRFNYWMVIFHFLIFELELLISLFVIFGIVSFNSNNLVCILLSLLFIELLIAFLPFYIPIILIILIGTIYSILLDELIIGNTQRRKGPFNLGGYGILSSIINGFNLIITQFIIPKLYIHY